MRYPVKIMYVQPKAELGGSDVALLALLSGVDKNRFAPFVVVPGRGPLTAEYERLGAQVVCFPLSVVCSTSNPLEMAGILARLPLSAWQLKCFIRREGISLVHTNSSVCLSGPLGARLAGVPAITHVREIASSHQVIHYAVLQYMALLSDRIIAISHAVRRGLPTSLTRDSRVVVVCDGVDVARVDACKDPTYFRQRWSVPSRDFLVGVVGRITRMKGIEYVIEACRIAAQAGSSVRCIVVGDAPANKDLKYLKELQKMVRDTGMMERVIFCGAIRDISTAMIALDVIVLGSIQTEGLGGVLLEAMACGKPGVATRTGGPEEVIEDGVTGFLVPPADAQAIAKAIVTLAGDSDRRKQMGEAARKSVLRRFSLDNHVRAVTAQYDQLLNLGSNS